MNLAKMLAERMKSPGALGEFKDRTSHPDPLKYVEAGNATQMPGSGKQEPYPMDTEGSDDDMASRDTAPETPGSQPGDAGLGMLEHAAKGAHGKRKAAFEKAVKHGRSKHAQHMPPPKGGHSNPGKKH